jgi:hypothetical protein
MKRRIKLYHCIQCSEDFYKSQVKKAPGQVLGVGYAICRKCSGTCIRVRISADTKAVEKG